MSIIKCKECGAQISDMAPVCPVCGAPRTTTTNAPATTITTGKGLVYARNILFFLYAAIGAIALFALLSIHGGPDMSKVAEEMRWDYMSEIKLQEKADIIKNAASPLVTGYWIILIASIAGICLAKIKIFGQSLKKPVLIALAGYAVAMISILMSAGDHKDMIKYIYAGYNFATFAWTVCIAMAIFTLPSLLIKPSTRLNKIVLTTPLIIILIIAILFLLIFI